MGQENGPMTISHWLRATWTLPGMLSAGLVGLCLVLGLILGSVDLYNKASRPLPFKQLGPFSSSSVSLEISSNEKKSLKRRSWGHQTNSLWRRLLLQNLWIFKNWIFFGEDFIKKICRAFEKTLKGPKQDFNLSTALFLPNPRMLSFL